jgi:hypothetical protein
MRVVFIIRSTKLFSDLAISSTHIKAIEGEEEEEAK